MKVLIAAASFASKISGIQRHALNLARCLLLQPEVTAVHWVVAPWQQQMADLSDLSRDPRFVLHVALMRNQTIGRNLWYYRDLPQLAARLQVDIVHLACPMPVHGRAFHCPTVVTLHDLYPCEIPQNFGFPKFIFNRIILGQCLREVDAVACVSDATHTLLRRYFPAVSGKAIRIYNCVEAPGVANEPIPGCYGPFLLSVAQHRRNKNIPLLIRTFHLLLRSACVPAETRLFVIGIRGPESSHLDRLIARFTLQDHVYLLEGLKEAELNWCYRHCAALIAPSITEGFGLPVAEGILAGCRVVASDIPAHREISGCRCTLVPLNQNAKETLATAIVAALRAPKPQPSELPQFSASVLATQYVALYQSLLASRAAQSTFRCERLKGTEVLTLSNQQFAQAAQKDQHECL